MTNKEKYNFDDFTQKHYCEILQLAKQNYEFTNYENFKEKELFLLWRHDVDFSLDYSLDLAKIENEFNISSTYFLHLHNEFYNLLEFRSKEVVNQLIKLGHNIGIHFDTHFYDIKTEEEIEKYLNLEKMIFFELFGVTPKAFSFHNTNDFVMSCQADSYAGLINTYAKVFQTEIQYCSDSNGYWRFARLYDLIKERRHKKLQVLTHPEWWQEIVRSPKERINHIIDNNAHRLKIIYEDLLRKYGRKNIDWE